MISHGLHTVIVAAAPGIWKKNLYHGFMKYGNWARASELALFASVPRLAIAWQIPLIFWGENPALTIGELGVKSKGYDGNQTKWMNTLQGGDPSWLCVDGIEPKDVLIYHYPSDDAMQKARLQIVYLGYFWQVWTRKDNGMISAMNGLDVRERHPLEIGDILGVDALDEDWVIVN